MIGPWDRQLTQVTLEAPVSIEPSYVGSGGVWALEVVDPRDARVTWRCLPLSGSTTPIMGNQPIWWCTRGDGSGDARGLNDLITDRGPVWKILFHDPEQSELLEADVAVAWS